MRSLELREFYICCFQKYVVEKNKQKQIIIEYFLFCNFWQIWIIRHFISKFCLQANIIFNTNYLNLLLIIIIEISNIDKSFSIVYCFAIFESKKIFIFIFKILKNLIFYNCINSCIIVNDFVLELFFVIIKTR